MKCLSMICNWFYGVQFLSILQKIIWANWGMFWGLFLITTAYSKPKLNNSLNRLPLRLMSNAVWSKVWNGFQISPWCTNRTYKCLHEMNHPVKPYNINLFHNDSYSAPLKQAPKLWRHLLGLRIWIKPVLSKTIQIQNIAKCNNNVHRKKTKPKYTIYSHISWSA